MVLYLVFSVFCFLENLEKQKILKSQKTSEQLAPRTPQPEPGDGELSSHACMLLCKQDGNERDHEEQTLFEKQ